MSTQTDEREIGRLSGAISQHIFDEFVSAWNLRFNGEEFGILDMETAQELGLPDDDETLVIQRKRDGKLFEVDLEVLARPFTPPARPDAPQEIPGQEPLPGVTP